MKKVLTKIGLLALSAVFLTMFVFAQATPSAAAESSYLSFDFTGEDGADVAGMVSNMKIKDNQLYYDGTGEKFNDFAGSFDTFFFRYEFKIEEFDLVNGNNFGFDFNTTNAADRKRVNLDVRSANGTNSNALYFNLAGGQSWSDNPGRRLNFDAPSYQVGTTYTITIIFDKTMVENTEVYVLSGYINDVWFVEQEYTMAATSIQGFALFARNNGKYLFDNLVIGAVPEVYPDGSMRRAQVGKLYSAFSFDNLNPNQMVRGFSEGNLRPNASGELTSVFGTLTNDSYNKYHINPYHQDSTNLNPVEGVFSVDAKIANRGTYNRFAIDFNFGNYGIGNEYRLNVNIHGNGNAYVDLTKLQTGQVAKTWEVSASTVTQNIRLSFDTYYTYKLYFEKNTAGFYVLSVFIDDQLILEHVTSSTTMGPSNVKGFGLIVNKISDAGGDFTSDVTFDNLYIAALKDRYIDGSPLRKSSAPRQYANYSFSGVSQDPISAVKEGSGFIQTNGVWKSASINEFNAIQILTPLDQFAFDVDVRSLGDGTGGLRFGYNTSTFYDLHFEFNAAGGSVTVYQGPNQYRSGDATKGGKTASVGLFPNQWKRIGVIVETINPTTSNLSVYVDGVCVIDAVVAKVESGRLGLIANQSDIEYDNLTVTAIGTDTYYDGTSLRALDNVELEHAFLHFQSNLSSNVEFGTNDAIVLHVGHYPEASIVTQVQWSVNGVILDEASTSLTLTAMDYFGLGPIVVKVVYNGIIQSNEVTFSVDYDSITSISIEVDQTSISLLESATLEASFLPVENTNPSPVVTWKVNNVTVLGQVSSTYVFNPTATGSFLITASVGDVVSNIVTVEVAYAPLTGLVVSAESANLTTFDDTLISLQTDPSTGWDPALDFGWRVNGVDHNETGRTWTFSTLTPGTYDIQAYQGSLESNILRITVTQGVYDPITAVTLVSNVTNLTLGDTATLQATHEPTVGIEPGLQYVWFVDDVALNDNHSATFAFTPNQTGSYSIRVTYGGVTSNTINLVVAYVPVASVDVTASASAITLAQTVTLQATYSPTANTDPGLSYVWKVNGQVQTSESTAQFVFAPTAVGTYSITVEVGGIQSNAVGLTVSYVRVSGVSLTTDLSSIKSNQQASLSIVVTPTSLVDPNRSVVWRVNGEVQTDQHELSFILQNREAGSYVVTCEVDGMMSNQVIIQITQAFRFDLVGYISGGVTILAAAVFFLLKRIRK